MLNTDKVVSIDELTKATQDGDLATIARALDSAINVNRPDSQGWTALVTAAAFATLETSQLLLDRGSAINGTDNRGETALFKAASRGSVEFVRLLLDRGADVNARAKDGSVPLNPALTNRRSEAHMEIIELFLSFRARTDTKDDDGWTPLHQAARNNNVTGASLLLRYGAQINAKANDGSTPLDLHLQEEQGAEGASMTSLLSDAGGEALKYRAAVAQEEGRSFHTRGDFKAAIRCYERAIQLDPADPDI
jgi:ankyrin repeat protein